MQMLNKILLGFFCCLLLAGCAGLHTAESPRSSLNWQQRQAKLQGLNHWTSQGTLGMRMPQHAWSASFTWQQGVDEFNLGLWGPLGLGSLNISGTAHNVQLMTSQGKRYQALTVQQLLHQRTGWYLPVEVLRFWVLGIPAPDSKAILKFDTQQRLSSLQQQGWTVEYKAYQTAAGIELPSLLAIYNSDLSIHIAIKQWSL
jgi:outer membrane lipoprotein LolB